MGTDTAWKEIEIDDLWREAGNGAKVSVVASLQEDPRAPEAYQAPVLHDPLAERPLLTELPDISTRDTSLPPPGSITWDFPLLPIPALQNVDDIHHWIFDDPYDRRTTGAPLSGVEEDIQRIMEQQGPGRLTEEQIIELDTWAAELDAEDWLDRELNQSAPKQAPLRPGEETVSTFQIDPLLPGTTITLSGETDRTMVARRTTLGSIGGRVQRLSLRIRERLIDYRTAIAAVALVTLAGVGLAGEASEVEESAVVVVAVDPLDEDQGRTVEVDSTAESTAQDGEAPGPGPAAEETTPPAEPSEPAPVDAEGDDQPPQVDEAEVEQPTAPVPIEFFDTVTESGGYPVDALRQLGVENADTMAQILDESLVAYNDQHGETFKREITSWQFFNLDGRVMYAGDEIQNYYQVLAQHEHVQRLYAETEAADEASV